VIEGLVLTFVDISRIKALDDEQAPIRTSTRR
jgi:hypothetical protein